MIELLKNYTESFKSLIAYMVYLKQDEEEFYTMVRDAVQKRLRIVFFSDDGDGQAFFQIKYRHWWYVPFYFVFRSKKRILAQSMIIVAEEYMFPLTGRKIITGYTNFVYGSARI